MFLRVLLVASIAALVVTATVPTFAPSLAAVATKEKAKVKAAPSASQKAARQRMRDCGAEWQAMKKAGKTKDTTWRRFSQDCLAAGKK
jgi:hypothetical protein